MYCILKKIMANIGMKAEGDRMITPIDQQKLIDMDRMVSRKECIPSDWDIHNTCIGASPLQVEYLGHLCFIFACIGTAYQEAAKKYKGIISYCENITYNVYSNWVILPLPIQVLKDMSISCREMQHIYNKSYSVILAGYSTEHLHRIQHGYSDDLVFRLKYGESYGKIVVSIANQISHLGYSVQTGIQYAPYMLSGTLYSTILCHVLRDGIKYFSSIGIPVEKVLHRYFGSSVNIHEPMDPITDNIRLSGMPGTIFQYVDDDGVCHIDSIESRIFNDRDTFDINRVVKISEVPCLFDYQSANRGH